MSPLLQAMVGQVVSAVVSEVITTKNKQKYGAKVFDFIEKEIIDSETKIDDATVLPVVKALRAAFDIPETTGS